jgi:hypothetical protein
MKSLQFQVSSTGLAELLCALELQFLNWQPDTLFIGIIRAKMFKLKLVEEASGLARQFLDVGQHLFIPNFYDEDK